VTDLSSPLFTFTPIKKGKTMKKGDIIVLAIVSILAIGLLLFNGYRNTNDEPVTVEVRIDGELIDTFSIEEDVSQVYTSEFGSNTLTIMDQVVSVSDADCRDQICVDTKHGRGNGDAIVCVPNRFTVELIGEGGDIDAIAR